MRHLRVVVRANIDGENYDQAAGLFAILAAEGLAGELTVYLGHLRWDAAAPGLQSGCGEPCLGRQEFARFDHEFAALAARSGFATWLPPQPAAFHCAPMSDGALVVGAEGELHRCLGLAGNPAAVIGDIRNTAGAGAGRDMFPGYDPFADAECRGCIALPLCMGGCARDAIAPDPATRANRCHEFRYSHGDLILRCAQAEEAKLRAA